MFAELIGKTVAEFEYMGLWVEGDSIMAIYSIECTDGTKVCFTGSFNEDGGFSDIEKVDLDPITGKPKFDFSTGKGYWENTTRGEF